MDTKTDLIKRMEQLLPELDLQQRALYERYRYNPDFCSLLRDRTYDQLPAYLDYVQLLEHEVGEAQMPETFARQIQERDATNQEAALLREAFSKKNHWSEELLPANRQLLTTPGDLSRIDALCATLTRNQHDANAVLVSFFKELITAKKRMIRTRIKNKTLEELMAAWPADWYKEPWYYIYVQYFGVDEKGVGNFQQLTEMLAYLEAIGIKNIYILPHYQSPDGDAGYDISDYRPANKLGGEEAFTQFMQEALARGFRIATDLVFNHTSAEHEWFQGALSGKSKYFRYYLPCPAHWDELPIDDILKDEKGDFFLYLPERGMQGEAVVSKRILIFPDVDKTLWLKKEVPALGKTICFYRTFYPFQLDLDMQNPSVMEELFRFLGEEISTGVAGKRTDAIAHWIKEPGTPAKDLPATYALQQLVKQFLKHLSPNTIILPEVVTTSKRLKTYAGDPTRINGHATTTGGDALLDFQLQAMLREMVYFQKTTPFWTQIHNLGETGNNTAAPLVPIEHHDETYMGFIQELQPMRNYIQAQYNYLDADGQQQKAHRGIIYKNGMSGGARYADCLNRDQRRIANAFFCLYLLPATPVVYYGTEIGATNQWEQMRNRQQEQYETLERLLGADYVGPGKAISFETCEDPRELQRGPIASTEFYDALRNNHAAVETVKLMNLLREEHSALRTYHLADIPTWTDNVLGLIRYPENYEPGGRPLLALSNLSERQQEVKMPTKVLQKKLGRYSITLTELLRQEGDSPLWSIVSSTGVNHQMPDADFMHFYLKPYSFVLFIVN